MTRPRSPGSATGKRRAQPSGSSSRSAHASGSSATPRSTTPTATTAASATCSGAGRTSTSLVRSGAASVWFFDGDRGRFARELLAGARTAKAQKRGAWGACRARLDPSGAFETYPKLAAAPQAAAGGDCHPSYAGACLDPSVSDYDCAGGSGNGPAYSGRVRVVGHDEYDLDPNGDGVGCEN